MSKFASFAEYPKRSLAGAEAALLTAWASLSRYHDHLVLVGGLAVKYLTRPGAGLLPGPVTMGPVRPCTVKPSNSTSVPARKPGSAFRK